MRSMAARPAAARWVRPLRGEPWLSALLAGVVSAVVSLLAARVGPFWSGMLSSLPLISACALIHLRLAGGAGDVASFVAGYLRGIVAKALFIVVFALLVSPLGAPPALGLALAAGAAGAWLLAQAQRRGRAAKAPSLADAT